MINQEVKIKLKGPKFDVKCLVGNYSIKLIVVLTKCYSWVPSDSVGVKIAKRFKELLKADHLKTRVQKDKN